MIRTQIQITEEQQARLRAASAATGRSIADLVRDGIDYVIANRGRHSRDARIARALKLSGRFSSGHSDVSQHHDRYLAEAYR